MAEITRRTLLGEVHRGESGGAFAPYDGGVSEYGGKVIERMNMLGTAVDLGQASDKIKLDALAISKKPVILSHGSCRALIPGGLRDDD